MKVLLKTLAFRSFQISQVIRTIAVLRPPREGDGMAARSFQYSKIVPLVAPMHCMSVGHFNQAEIGRAHV